VEHPIQQAFAIGCLVGGLSHLVQPGQWARYFAGLAKSGCGGLHVAVYTFPVGLFLVLFHNRWQPDWTVAITLCGWMMTLKSALYFVRPELFDRVIKRGGGEPASFRRAGAVMLAAGCFLTFKAFLG
jgi:uncharacterized protein YjeT (DUF2065 family)